MIKLSKNKKRIIMQSSELKNKNYAFWVLQVGGWLFLWLFYQSLYYHKVIKHPKTVLGLFITYLAGFCVSSLLRYFYRKIDYQSRSIFSLARIAVLSSLLSSQIWYLSDIFLSMPIWGFDFIHRHLVLVKYLENSFWNYLIIITWSALYFVIKFWNEWKLQQARTEQANALAQSAQLQMLRYQLNPHFLFNSLNSIRALIDEDKKNARQMITELSEFLRYSLVSKSYSNVPLKNEIEAIRHYFAIEKKRYEEKLNTDIDIHPLAEDFPVLSFLIHPLIENAIKYGMQTSSMPLKIRLKAVVKNNTLKIEVSNTGKWVEPIATKENSQGTGTGLANVRQRLANAFPNSHRFEIHEDEDGVHVVLEINKDFSKSNEKSN